MHPLPYPPIGSRAGTKALCGTTGCPCIHFPISANAARHQSQTPCLDENSSHNDSSRCYGGTRTRIQDAGELAEIEVGAVFATGAELSEPVERILFSLVGVEVRAGR